MIYGIGTDIIHVNRIKVLSNDYNDPFFKKVFTPAEYEEAVSRQYPLMRFCTIFAAKEAIYKALNADGSLNNLDFSAIEILSDKRTGAPIICFYGDYARHAEKNGLKVKVSVSYDTDYAVAFAICEN